MLLASCVTKHAEDPESIALFYEDALGNRARYTFSQLRDLSSQSAGALKALGVTKGDRVATLLPKSPELLVTTLGLWRLGAAHVPLFTAFGPQAIASRVENSQACVLVKDAANRHKVSSVNTEPDPHKLSRSQMTTGVPMMAMSRIRTH
ncbi:MAG: hypothetical protein CM1200mP18_17890 [Gammaproteobacteria bacterium]|nr:MAG: hypothetical protein CM1200mP18_17890 [Gammaproteobacteria bacterium]